MATESRTGTGAVEQRLGSNSPSQQTAQQPPNMDPNNAVSTLYGADLLRLKVRLYYCTLLQAYLALRNHPETTIRPINSSGELRSPGQQGEQEQEPSRAMEENLFKQVRPQLPANILYQLTTKKIEFYIREEWILEFFCLYFSAHISLIPPSLC